LKSLLKQKREQIDQKLISFIDTLLLDIKRYRTLPTYTLRKLVLPEKTNKEPYDVLIKNIVDLKRKIGIDYLEIILKRTSNIDDDIIIAVENNREQIHETEIK